MHGTMLIEVTRSRSLLLMIRVVLRLLLDLSTVIGCGHFRIGFIAS